MDIDLADVESSLRSRFFKKIRFKCIFCQFLDFERFQHFCLCCIYRARKKNALLSKRTIRNCFEKLFKSIFGNHSKARQMKLVWMECRYQNQKYSSQPGSRHISVAIYGLWHWACSAVKSCVSVRGSTAHARDIDRCEKIFPSRNFFFAIMFLHWVPYNSSDKISQIRKGRCMCGYGNVISFVGKWNFLFKTARECSVEE